MQILLDACLGLWIALVSIGLVCVPAIAGRGSLVHSPLSLAGRAILIFSVAVPLSASAHLFNWLTVLLMCAVSMTGLLRGRPVLYWPCRMAAMSRGEWAAAARSCMRSLILGRRARGIGSLAIIAAAGPAMQSLLNARLAGPGEHALLATTQRLMAGEGLGIFLPTPALLAVVSTLSTADPMQTLRFLNPILHAASALTAAHLVWRAAGQRHLAWAAGALAGLILLPVYSTTALLAISTLLAGLAILVRARRLQLSVAGACGLLALSVGTVPPMAIIAACASAVIVSVPLRYVPEAIGLVFLLAALVPPNVLGDLATLIHCFIALGALLVCRRLVRHPLRVADRQMSRLGPYTRAAIVAPVFLMILAPSGTHAEYTESDAAARQALALKHAHAQGTSRWAVVGTPEQRIQIGAAAQVVDLQDFVLRYSESGGSPRFRFDLPVDRMYIFVEKRPPAIPLASTSLRGAVADRAVYRLPRRRASLQRAALELCESYRRTHTEECGSTMTIRISGSTASGCEAAWRGHCC